MTLPPPIAEILNGGPKALLFFMLKQTFLNFEGKVSANTPTALVLILSNVSSLSKKRLKTDATYEDIELMLSFSANVLFSVVLNILNATHYTFL